MCATCSHPSCPYDKPIHYGPSREDAIAFADTCCGKCPGGTCYVDQMTGA